MAAAPTCGGWRRPCGWGQPYAVSLSVRGLLQPILLMAVQGLALKCVAAETTTNFKELIAKSQLNINEGTL